MEIGLKGTPNPKQAEFFLSTKRHIAYGGARGGGKSWAMRRKFVLLALNYPGLKLLLLRRTLPELRENHILPLLEELNKIATYNESQKSFVFSNKSRIRLGYCDSEKDVYQYQGAEFDVIGLEEATHFTETQKDFLLTCNRTTREDFKPRCYYTSNPGNVGHNWFKRLFVDREYTETEYSEDYHFIPAKIYDNKVLMNSNPDYLKALENLSPDMRKAHLEGDWDIFEGQYFTEFKRDIHVIEPFMIPSNWNRYISIDYGLDMFAAIWYAVDYRGNVYAYKELHESNLIISEAAKRLLEVNNGDKYQIIYAPPDLYNRRQDTGKSADDIFRENNVNLFKAKNDRVSGWYSVKEWLKVYDTRHEQTGEAIKDSRLKIFNNCTTLIKHIPKAQCDTKNPNDIANEPHYVTHILDSLRYFLCMRTQSSIKQKQGNIIEGFFGRKEKQTDSLVADSFSNMGINDGF